MSGPWESYQDSGPWTQYATKPTTMKLGRESFLDILRDEVKGADAGTRNIAGFGTALSDVYQGAKQFFGAGDRTQIEAQQVLSDAAPVGSVAGNVAMTAIPFAGVTKIGTAAKVGGGLGALQPVAGEQTAENIAKGKLLNAAGGAVFGAGGQALANKSGQMLADKLQTLQAQKKINAPRDQMLQEAIDLGLVATPSSVNPSAANTVLESVGGKALTAQQASNKNAGIFDDVARKTVGLASDEPLTSEAMQQIRKQAYQTGYEPLQQIGIIPTAKKFDDALLRIGRDRVGAGTIKATERADITDLVQSHRNTYFDTGDAVNAIRVLREDAQQAYRAGDKALGSAQRAIADAYENEIEDVLRASGKNGAELLRNFREARKLMAKAHTIEDAIVEGGGTVNVRKFAQQLQRGKPLEGDLKTVAAFANNFPKASQPAAQVGGAGVSALNAFASLGLGAGGAYAGGPEGALLGAIPFLTRPAARAAMLSRGSQNRLLDMYRVGAGPRAGNALAQYSPAIATALGLDALD